VSFCTVWAEFHCYRLPVSVDGSGELGVFEMRDGFRSRHTIALHISGTNSREVRFADIEAVAWPFPRPLYELGAGSHDKRSHFERRDDRTLRTDANRFGRPKKLEA
jgi:hypothetical protein